MRVSQATIKRLDKLEAPLRAKRNVGAYAIALQEGIDAISEENRQQFTRGQWTVLSWPRIRTHEKWQHWENEAARQQDALIAAAAEDRAVRAKREPPVIGPDPANVSHRYR